MANVLEALTDDEAYLYALLTDESGLDQAEFCWVDHEAPEGVWRAWPFQWRWFRNKAPLQIDQCFAAGTLVLTERGQIPIEDVQIGDHVLTHTGQWKLVTYTWDKGEQPTVVVKGHGHPGLRTTEDHKFFTPDGDWKVPVEGSLWGSPSVFPSSDVPVLPERTYAPGRPSNIPVDVTSPDFLWLYGLYLAEGSCSSSFGREGTVNRTTFSVHTDEVAKVEAALTKVGIRFNTQQVANEACFNIVINSRPLAEWFTTYGGKGAHNKELAPWVLGLSSEQRRGVLDGAMFGDGYIARNEYCTVSRKLAIGIKLLGQSMGYTATFRSSAGGISSIDGREVCGGERYVIGFSRTGKAARRGPDNHWWSRVKSRIEAPSVRCYDLEVEDDHSFVAEGIVVSNCGRSVGKSLSIKMRAFAFPFIHPGQEMVITAPELVHLNPIVGLVENQFLNTRLGREMLPKGRNRGITHRPFQMDFLNGSRIIGRIPQRDGKGVKGVHPLWLELDEGQDFPDPGWIEVIETLKRGHEGAVWRAHGVTKGVRDYFYKFTQPESGWTVHRYCLPGDTMVYCTDKPRPICELEPGTEVWSITQDGQLTHEKTTALIPNGVRPTWRIRAKGGYGLVSTYNHPYLILHRGGTKRTRRELKFEWVDASDLLPGDYIVCAKELPESGSRIPLPEEITTTLEAHSPERTVPEWVWEAPRALQLAFLHGYLMGDGSLSRQPRGQSPWQIGTASPKMAKELRSLCHYLGFRCSLIEENECGSLGNGSQYRFVVYPDHSWFAQIPKSYSQVRDGEWLEGLGKNFVARRVLSSEPTGESVETYDITVGTNHNFIAEGVVVHNTAMHRPTWSDQERTEKIEQYGSRDHPDYRRNISGLHGDATNPLFVLHRLMQCVDQEQDSDYNQNTYHQYRVNHEYLMDTGQGIINVLQFPDGHKELTNTFWAGMDVGYTNHPSEILVFGDIKNVFTLLTRIHLERISHGSQVEAILHVIKWYGLKAFSMDKTGLGLPLFQDIQERAPQLAPNIKGYNFSAKILVDFDQTVEVDEFRGDLIKDAGMERNVLEYASDRLRGLVDQKKIKLPWDRDLIGEFQGQTYTVMRDTMNLYGKKEYSKGTFHALDAARMAVLGKVQTPIEEFVKEEKWEPPPMFFLDE